ncbi:MAG: orotidine 5'-phosphate decarboxylase / HUMPS family protein [Bacteroidia bacterium]
MKHKAQGLVSMERTMQFLNNRAFTIADAKRGDIGNTATMYAQSVFDYYKFNAITLSPYMVDTVEPFLKYKNHWSIVLALTSNPGADDFEMLETGEEKFMKSHKKICYFANVRTGDVCGRSYPARNFCYHQKACT